MYINVSLVERKLTYFYPACALRALGLLLEDGALTVGGGRLFGASAGSPHENGRNSGTKSRRLDLWVSNAEHSEIHF